VPTTAGIVLAGGRSSRSGVGCSLTLHVQDNEIVKVTSPDDHDVTRGNLCIKGRFGFQHVQPKADGG
jgi:predicted molibdopterin-dependent oxidoreductase YjgC